MVEALIQPRRIKDSVLHRWYLRKKEKYGHEHRRPIWELEQHFRRTDGPEWKKLIKIFVKPRTTRRLAKKRIKQETTGNSPLQERPTRNPKDKPRHPRKLWQQRGTPPKRAHGAKICTETAVRHQRNSTLVPGRDGNKLNSTCYNWHKPGQLAYKCSEAGWTGLCQL